MGLFKMFSSAPEPLEEEDDVRAHAEDDGSSDVHAPPAFDAVGVLEAAGVHAEQRARVAKAQELLSSLPAGTPDELKRNIVEAALKAFDVSIEAIVTAAAAEIDALDHFIEEGNRETARQLEEGAAAIQRLEAEITDIKRRMEQAESDQEGLDAATRAEIARVRPVKDFFTHRVGAPEPDNDVEVDMTGDAAEGPATIIVDESLTREASARK